MRFVSSRIFQTFIRTMMGMATANAPKSSSRIIMTTIDTPVPLVGAKACAKMGVHAIANATNVENLFMIVED